MENVNSIVVDFDGTIAFFRDYKDGEYVELNSAISALGIPKGEVERIYRITRDKGFSIERLIHELQNAGYFIDEVEANKVIQSWLSKNLAIFPDVSERMSFWMASGRKVFVLTTGDADWQRQKVDALNLDFTEMFVTATDKEKVGLIQQLYAKHGSLVVLDDKPGVLDALRDLDTDNEKFRTIRVSREQGKYQNDTAEHKHLTVTTFSDSKVLE